MNNSAARGKKLSGIIPPVITPLREDGSLDTQGFERLIEYGIQSGIDGIFVMGSSGEAMCFTKEFWREVIRKAIGYTRGRIPVLCGVIDSSTAGVIENIKMAEQEGAAFVVATPSFYIQNTCQDEILRHYEKICSETRLNVIAYNIPGMTHANIEPETVKALSRIDNLVALKDSSASWEQIQRLLFLLRDTHVALFNGAEELCAAAMAFGADGCVPGLANFFPGLFVRLAEAAREKDLTRAFELQEKVWEIRKALFVGSSWVSAMKYIGMRMGFGEGRCAWPIEPLTGSQKQRIDEILAAFTEV